MRTFLVSLTLLASISAVFAQDTMTPDRFRAIAAMPGDSVPLIPQLSAVPYWTNAVASNVMTYATGQVFREQMPVSVRTVGGKYLIATATSRFYKRQMTAILTYDAKSSSLKAYGLYPDAQGQEVLTEGNVVYDFKHRAFSMSSTYGGFQESSSGTYSDFRSTEKSIVYKDGQLVMTRETVITPVTASKQ